MTWQVAGITILSILLWLVIVAIVWMFVLDIRDARRRKRDAIISAKGVVDLMAKHDKMIAAHQAGLLSTSPDPIDLEETWSPEKIEAWRAIDVTVTRPDPDGLWLGFPHPDGPDAPVVAPVFHAVGVELVAECKGRLYGRKCMCVDAPGENCQSGYGSGCGYYAFKTREQAVGHALRSRPIWPSTKYGTAVARVFLSGKVIEHERGYRAEILEVLEVETPDGVKPDLSAKRDLLMAQWKRDLLMAQWISLSTARSLNDPYGTIFRGNVSA